MKTADLIPFILLELNDGDKYGFELSKNIETRLGGQIEIKQPTLYTVLKKLEKSKFISSYWQDSEIGGKRHYYKLTSNGKSQVATLPSYNFLTENLSNEGDVQYDQELPTPQVEKTEIKEEVEPKKVSFMDALLASKEPQETIIPSSEVFSDNSIDNATERDVNLSNVEVLKAEEESQDQKFAENENIVAFTEKIPTISTPELIKTDDKIEITENTKIFDITDYNFTDLSENIAYVDYVDYKTTDTYKQNKKLAKSLSIKTTLTSLYLVVMLTLCALASKNTGTSPLYYVFFSTALVGFLFYVTLSVRYIKNIQFKNHNFNFKQRLIVNCCVIAVVLLVCIITNINIGNNSMLKIFSFKNFENLYAPLLLTATLFIDMVLGFAFLKKINK